MDRIEQRILQIIDDNAPRLQALAEDIFDHAEPRSPLIFCGS